MTEREDLNRFLERHEPRHTFRPSERMTAEDFKVWESVGPLSILKAIGWDKVRSLNWIFEPSPLAEKSKEPEAVEARRRPKSWQNVLFLTGERLVELLHDLFDPDEGHVLAVPSGVDRDAWNEICRTHSDLCDFLAKREELTVLSMWVDEFVCEIFARDDDIAESIWSGLESPEDLVRFRTGFGNWQTGLLWALGIPFLIALPLVVLYVSLSGNLFILAGALVYGVIFCSIAAALLHKPLHLETVLIHDFSLRFQSGRERKTVRFEDISFVTWTRDLVSRKMMIKLKDGEEVLLRPVGEDMFQGIVTRVREARPDLRPAPADAATKATGSLEDAAHEGQSGKFWLRKWKGSPDHEYNFWGRRPKR